MPRFFIDEKSISDDIIILDEENSNHISKVLRSKIGDEITCCDKKENDFDCTILEISKKEVTLKIDRKYKNVTEPKTKITLFQALPKQSKMELIIEKNVEIGVSAIVPVETKFCIAKKSKSDNKNVRLNKISETASKQCNRGIIPYVSDTISLKEINVEDFDAFIVAYEKEKDLKIKDYVRENADKLKNIAILIGSEGGLSEDEIDYLKNRGASIVSLSSRILRTETASIFLSSILLYELEE